MMYRSLLIVLAIACVFTVHNVLTRYSPPLPISNEHLRNLQELMSQRRYNILSLGGSMTWGANLPHHTHSYPYILGSPSKRVTNGAIDATGSNYPSLCIECIVGNKEYNVILLEFSLNGHDGLELLLKRLRHRFPDAIIIYVHLYSLQTDVADSQGRSPAEQKGTYIENLEDYHWGYGERISNAVLRDISNVAETYGAYVYALPKTSHVADSVDYFVPDFSNLSQEGHNTIAEGLLRILKDAPTEQKKKGLSLRFRKRPLEISGSGEECISWFTSGKVPIQYRGIAGVVSFDAFGGNKVYALEFSGSGTMYVESKFDEPVPLYMFFMSKSEAYPIVEVLVHEKVKIVDPITNSEHDVMKSEIIGWADPGMNVVEIKIMTDSVLPFRVTGFAFCEACNHFEQVV